MSKQSSVMAQILPYSLRWHFERPRNRPGLATDPRSLKRARRLRAPSQPRGIARLSRRAFHAHASWVAAAPQSASTDPSTRFPPPLARRALDQPDGRCQHRRQNRATTGNRAASRRAHRGDRRATRLASRRSRRDAGSRGQRRAASPRATGGDPRADRVQQANRIRRHASRRAFDVRDRLKTPPDAGVRGLDPSRTRTPFRERTGAFFFSLSRPASERESRRVLSD